MKRLMLLSMLLLTACPDDGSSPDAGQSASSTGTATTSLGSCTCTGAKGTICFDYYTDKPEECKAGTACGAKAMCATPTTFSTCGGDNLIPGQWSDGPCSIAPCCRYPRKGGYGFDYCYQLDGEGMTDAKTACAISDGKWE